MNPTTAILLGGPADLTRKAITEASADLKVAYFKNPGFTASTVFGLLEPTYGTARYVLWSSSPQGVIYMHAGDA